MTTRQATPSLGLFLLAFVVCAAGAGPDPAPAGSISGFPTRSAARFAVGDINHDGRKDIIVIEPEGKQGYIFLQQGNHAFSAHADHADYLLNLGPMPQPWGVAVGDFDGDRKDDIAVHGGIGERKLCLYQSGSEPRRYLRSGNPGFEASVGDLNNDRRDDILTDGDVWFQRSYGGLADAYFYEVGRHGRAGTGDLDGDGVNDAAFSSDKALAQLFLHRTNYGEPDFKQRSSPDVTLGAGEISHDIALGDLNGDAKTDIAVAAGDRVAVFHQSAQGGFTADDAPALVIRGFAAARFVEVADFNRDGRKDLAVAENDAAGNVYIFTRIQVPSMSEKDADIILQFPYHPGGMQATDINHDGRTDLLVLTFKPKSETRLNIYLGR